MIESVGGDVKPLTSVPVPDLEIRSGWGGGGGVALIQTVGDFFREF